MMMREVGYSLFQLSRQRLDREYFPFSVRATAASVNHLLLTSSMSSKKSNDSFRIGTKIGAIRYAEHITSNFSYPFTSYWIETWIKKKTVTKKIHNGLTSQNSTAVVTWSVKDACFLFSLAELKAHKQTRIPRSISQHINLLLNTKMHLQVFLN